MCGWKLLGTALTPSKVFLCGFYSLLISFSTSIAEFSVAQLNVSHGHSNCITYLYYLCFFCYQILGGICFTFSKGVQRDYRCWRTIFCEHLMFLICQYLSGCCLLIITNVCYFLFNIWWCSWFRLMYIWLPSN